MKTKKKTAILGDISDSSLGKMLDQKKNRGIPQFYLGNKNVRWGCFDLSCLHMMPFEAHEMERYSIQRGDLVICEGGEPGRCAIWEDTESIMYQKALHRVRFISGVNAYYVYYWLCNAGKKGLLDQYCTGSTIKHLPGDKLRTIAIDLPDERIQTRIASILRSMDLKIKNNEAINQNLEQQAQTLYDHLCGDCSSNELVSLAELMDYAGGSQPPASEFIFEEKVGYVRFVQIRDYDTDSHITYIPVSSRNKLCEEHDIMIARYGASLGRICSGINGAYNVALAKVFPKQPYYREFLRCYLSSRAFYEGINNKGGRSAQAGFNQSDIKSFELRIPSEAQLIKFEGIASSMFEHRLSLKNENRKLASMRDTLLPRLMSGELDVSELEL